MTRDSMRLRRATKSALVVAMVLSIGRPVLPSAVAEDPPARESKGRAKVRDLVIVAPSLARRCRALDLNERPADLAELETRVSAWLATCVTSRTNDAQRERALVHGNRSLAEVWAALPTHVSRVRIVPRYTFKGERVTRVDFSSPDIPGKSPRASGVRASGAAATAPADPTTIDAAPSADVSPTGTSSPRFTPGAPLPIDPMLPDDATDLLVDVHELIERMREQGQTGRADELEGLAHTAKKALVSLAILAGAYYVGTKFRAGKLLIMWGFSAHGPRFARVLGRTERLLPGVERALEDVVVAARPHVSSAGAGLDWRVLDQIVDPSVPAQLDSAACGPACAQMVLRDRGLDIPQAELIERARASLHPEIKSKRVHGGIMLGVLQDLDPSGSWAGGALIPEFWRGKSARQLLEELGAKGSWIAQVDTHFVVIDRFDRDTNTLLVRDPWYEPARERGVVAGTHYRVSVKTFFEHWRAVAVYRA